MTNKEKVEKWLDKQIKMKTDAKLVLNKNCSFENLTIGGCSDKEIHISGVREIAKILNLETRTVDWHYKDSIYKFKTSFTYKNYKFFDLESEEDIK